MNGTVSVESRCVYDCFFQCSLVSYSENGCRFPKFVDNLLSFHL